MCEWTQTVQDNQEQVVIPDGTIPCIGPSVVCKCFFCFRYFCAMQLGLEARKTQTPEDYNKLYSAESDLSLLHIFESFLESAPQLVVQLFVVATLQEIRFFTGK